MAAVLVIRGLADDKSVRPQARYETVDRPAIATKMVRDLGLAARLALMLRYVCEYAPLRWGELARGVDDHLAGHP